MSLKGYGVLKSTPIETMYAMNPSSGNKMAHLEIHTRANKQDYRIALNVCSTETPSELRYVIDKNFKHPITKEFLKIKDGYTELESKPGGVAIDFLRQDLFDLRKSKTAQQIEGTDNELSDTLDFYLKKAISSDTARVYAFGQHWYPREDNPNEPDKYFNFVPAEGIHDIHMNQGNPGKRFQKDNGTYQDGALFIHFPSNEEEGGKWVAFFLGFQSQVTYTDNEGNPIAHESKAIEDSISIIVGDIGYPGSSPQNRSLLVMNTTNQDITINNWYIFLSKKNRFTLPDCTIKAGELMRIPVPEQISFSYSGGMISLFDNKSDLISAVTYTANDFYRKGRLVLFQNQRKFYEDVNETLALIAATKEVENGEGK